MAPIAPSEPGLVVDHGESITIGEAAEVRVNGLAVRTGPGEDFALLKGWGQPDPDEPWVLVQPELRLDAGALVVIDLGPIKRAATWWYRVSWLSPADETSGERILWEADGVAPIDTRGWVAGTRSADAWLAPAAFPDYGNGAQQLTPLAATFTEGPVAESGAGDEGFSFVSQPFVASGQILVDWAALWEPSSGTAFCTFRAVLQPLGAEVVIQNVIGGFAERTDRYPAAETGPWPNPLEPGEYVIEVWSDCSYSITVWQSQA